MSDSVSAAAVAPARIGVVGIVRAFLFIGAASFGGGVVAYLRENLVSGRGWLDDEFVRVMQISQTLAGLNATNMSVIIGDRLAGIPGAAAALIGMTLPGAIIMLGLGMRYAAHGNRPGIAPILTGVVLAVPLVRHINPVFLILASGAAGALLLST